MDCDYFWMEMYESFENDTNGTTNATCDYNHWSTRAVLLDQCNEMENGTYSSYQCYGGDIYMEMSFDECDTPFTAIPLEYMLDDECVSILDSNCNGTSNT